MKFSYGIMLSCHTYNTSNLEIYRDKFATMNRYDGFIKVCD